MNKEKLITITKEQYIELINQMLEKCTDIDKLELVYKISGKLIAESA